MISMDIECFNNPELKYKSVVFWSLNDLLTKEGIKQQLSKIKDAGLGGVFLHSRIGLVNEYLSDEWFDIIKYCCKEAEALGIKLWIYDEDKFPSGYGGGAVSKDPKLRSRGLVCIPENSVCESDIPICCYKTDNIKYSICIRTAPINQPWYAGYSYVDLLNPNTIERFLNSTHEKYKTACSSYFGNTVSGCFTDEICYLSHGQLGNVPAVPWTACLPDFFRSLHGYEITDFLPSLFFDVDDFKKIRFDFYDAATRLFVNSCTKPYYDWCDKNGLIFTGHLMAEDSLTYQTEWIGAAMPHYAYMHQPGIDKLGMNISQLMTVKQLTSVADQLGKPALCEELGCIGQQATVDDQRFITDWLMVNGITRLNPHLTLYSMRGERKRDCPPNISWVQPWWEAECTYATYTARICQELSRGKRIVDVLVLHPISGVWSEFTPMKKNNPASSIWAPNFSYSRQPFPEATEIYNKPFDELMNELHRSGYDFHLGDEIIMQDYGYVENHSLHIGCCTYSRVVIPPTVNIRKSTLEMLRLLCDINGNESVVFIGHKPSLADGSPCSIDFGCTAATTAEYINIIRGAEHKKIQIKNTYPEVKENSVLYNHRVDDSGETFFIFNSNRKKEFRGIIEIESDYEPFVLDAVSGKCFALPFVRSNGKIIINVIMYGGGSFLLRFEQTVPADLSYVHSLYTGIEFESRQYLPVKRISDFKVSFSQPNVLVLDRGVLTLGNKEYPYMPVENAAQEFYKAPDNTDFSFTYNFTVAQELKNKIFVAIEEAENLEKLLLDEKEIEISDAGYYIEEHIRKIPVNFTLSRGFHTLKITGKKINNIESAFSSKTVNDTSNYKPTEIEAAYILGDFSVFSNGSDFAIYNKRPVNTGDIINSGYPFYSGSVILSFRADIPDRDCRINFEGLNCAAAKLKINGLPAIIMFNSTPVALPATGEANMELTLFSTLVNTFGPRHFSGLKQKDMVGPQMFTDLSQYSNEYQLFNWGINAITITECK